MPITSFFYTYLFFSLINGPFYSENVPFNLKEPTLKITLSKELKEISALTWVSTTQIGAVQDEAGIFYILNSSTGKIEKKIKFSLPGDFEGLEKVDNTIYAITSSGKLFYFNLNNPEHIQTIETQLSWRNDVEGLAYDSQSNCLLIICKELGSTSDTNFKGKSIFSIDLRNNSFNPEPVATIKKSELSKILKTEKFKPSALAIDPLTQDIYILASYGKLMVVLNKQYQLKNVVKLPSKTYAQPEGICFSPEGDLFISNEGKDKKANFYYLKRKL